MPKNKKANLFAFGVQSKRFQSLGVHPSLDNRPYTSRYPGLYPGCYDSVKENLREAKGISYELSLLSEEFSKTLNHRADERLKAKKWLKAVNGPGWHDVGLETSTKSVSFAKAKRFPTSTALATPGPGIYGKDHIPHARLEEKSKAKAFSFSDVPSFEFDNCMPRSMSVHRSYHLPPNLYKVRSGTDELLAKTVSRRGPYDLFTGSRDETTLYGHSSKRITQSKENKSDLPSGVDYLINPCHRFKGKFMKCGRECYPTIRLMLTHTASRKPDPDGPGPNTYDPMSPRKPSNMAKFPFNSSVLHARPRPKAAMSPPPGRYHPKNVRKIIGDGMKSVFLSKVERGLPMPENPSWFGTEH